MKTDRTYKPKYQLWLAVVILSLMLSACSPENRAQQSPLLGFFERKSGLIAFVGLDGNIYTMNQNAGSMQQVTSNALLPTETEREAIFYQYPVWSPDSQQLAFIGFDGSLDDPTTGLSTIFTYDMENDEAIPQGLYETNSEFPNFISWSPAGDQLAFLSNTHSLTTRTLQLLSTQGGDPQLLDAGVPYRMDWAPDGNGLVVHVGGFDENQSLQRVSFLQTQDDEVYEQMLPVFPGVFNVPDWSPNGEYVAISSVLEDSANQTALILSGPNGQRMDTLKIYQGRVRVAFSPDSTKIAILNQTVNPTNGEYAGLLTVIDLESEEREEILLPEPNVIAFFWSPDSQKLAYFMYDVVTMDVLDAPLPPIVGPEDLAGPLPPEEPAPEEGEQPETAPEQPIQDALGLVRMNIFDLPAQDRYQVVFSFYPTQDYSNMLLNFDQYQRVATIWSPDSQNLVLAGQPTVEGAPVIMVAAASGRLEPRFLIDGVMAFWSWE